MNDIREMSRDEAALQWMAALRGGEYKQATGSLRDTDDPKAHCCLGVACQLWLNLGGDGGWKGTHTFAIGRASSSGFPPQDVKDWLGMDDDDMDHYIHMNDSEEKNFTKIAKEVERRTWPSKRGAKNAPPESS